MALGTTVYVASIMLTSVAHSYSEYILSQGVLSGLGVGMLCVVSNALTANYAASLTTVSCHANRFYPPLASISTHFNKYRATALGIAMAGSGLGEHSCWPISG